MVEGNATKMQVSRRFRGDTVIDNLREDVVNNVVFDDAMEDVATNEAKLAINSGESALGVSPGVGLVVCRFRMSVVEVCDSDDPVVHPQIRKSVHQECVKGAHRLRYLVQGRKNNEKANVGQQNKWLLGLGEDMGSRVEMALLVFWRFLSVRLGQALYTCSSIEEDVCRPAEKLVNDQ
jgi:hypothetical protein